MTFTVFRGNFASLWLALVAAARSLWAYLMFIFTWTIPEARPIPPPGDELIQFLPSEPGALWENLGAFFRLLFNWENFTGYTAIIGNVLVEVVRFAPMGLMALIPFVIIIRQSFRRHNNNYNRDTLPLRVFKFISNWTYTPTKRYIANLVSYAWHSGFRKLWLWIWLLNLNAGAIIIAAAAGIFFFAFTFDVVALFFFVYRIFIFALPLLHWVFIPVWIGVTMWLIDRWRKNVALRRLRHFEFENKRFIEQRSICTKLVGTMGKGKTTLVTDMVLSTEAIFRNKAYELMLEVDLMFPNFPWIVFEQELKEAIADGDVFNFASAAAWVSDIEKERYVFEYDHVKYGMYHDDKKTITYLFDALRDYAKLYLLYVTPSSLILSNYAIRTDFQIVDQGNMPLMDCDFFERPSATPGGEGSRHSHVLDFDMFRLGKKMAANHKRAASFQFGVVAITEVAKERGNQFKEQEIKATITHLKGKEKAGTATQEDLQDLVKLTDGATCLNDKFNVALKLIRHKCTVMGFPFACIFMDDQRPDSLGADARQLCEIVHIKDKSETRLAMPLHFIGELLHSIIFPRFKGLYQEYRFNRGDNTLLMYLIKKLGATVHSAHTGIYNRFGYHIRELAIEDGATNDVIDVLPYYLSTKKIYSGKFSTDCYGDIFAKGLRKCRTSLNDIPEYQSTKATLDELCSQNSYLINEITKYNTTEEDSA